MRPAPLSEGAVVEVVRRELAADADESFCRACHRASGGNPFYLRELLRALATESVLPRASRWSGWAASGRRRSRATCCAGSPVSGRERLSSPGRWPCWGWRPPARCRRARRRRGRRDAGAVAARDGDPRRGGALPLRSSRRARRGIRRPDARQARGTSPARRAVAARRGRRRRPGGSASACGQPRGSTWCVEALRSAARQAIGRGAPEIAVLYLRRALAELAAETTGASRCCASLGSQRSTAQTRQPSSIWSRHGRCALTRADAP